jgi:tRNA dimethylallyltransferase
LSPMPEIPAGLRTALRARFADAPATDIHAALAATDPAASARLRPTDRQRLLRALEVFEATGRSIVEWQAMPPSGPPPGMETCTILLLPPRKEVYAAGDARFGRMLDDGALEEVRALRGLGLAPDLPVMKALGVTELMGVLDGAVTLDDATAAVQQATRNYVKRQFTWFSRQIIANFTIEEKFSEKLAPEIFSFICKKGLTHHQ